MKITRVKCHVLMAPECSKSLNTASDDAVVEVHTDTGLTGIGEVESNPWVIWAAIERSGAHSMDRRLADLLIGQDPRQPAAMWEYLYEQSQLAGRRGAGIGAIGAVDMALWDIAGKAAGKPVWQLLGELQSESVGAYASLLPSGGTLKDYRESLLAKAQWARDAGFSAVKIEILIKGPLRVAGLDESDDTIVDLVAAGREVVGPEVQLMIDVGYCWRDWKEARQVFRRLEKHELYFIETPLWSDDLHGYARLADSTSIRIAAGELLSTRFEFVELMDVGKVHVVQPDVGRVGGISEAMRVAAMAADRGILVVPHCWKSGIGIAATAHVAAALPNCPLIEFLPAAVSESRLRKELVIDELQVENGRIPLPKVPGLGIELNRSVVTEFAEFAHRHSAGSAVD
ncbi:MAG: mandelate racemase/muconate lactonizing enzyme family protein [Acidobacteriota bacterium]